MKRKPAKPKRKKYEVKYSVEYVRKRIHPVRGTYVILDVDLAALYEVPTKALIQGVKRNKERFEPDCMFQLTDDETDNLRSQTVTSSWGGRRFNPYAFTFLGVAMTSSILRSPKATKTLKQIMRTFVALQQSHFDGPMLDARVTRLESRFNSLNERVGVVYQLIEEAHESEKPKPLDRPGFVAEPQAKYNAKRKTD